TVVHSTFITSFYHYTHLVCIVIAMKPSPPTSTLFPYTTLFRSGVFDELLNIVQMRFERIDIFFFSVTPSQGRDRIVLESIWDTRDRKSTRLNSSHVSISYDVFCLKKKNKRIHV